MSNKHKLSIIIIIIICIGIGIKAVTYKAAEVTIDFENFPLSSNQPLTRQVFIDNGIEISNWDNNLQSNGRIEETEDGNRYLSIYTPKGGYGTKTSGLQLEVKLPPGSEYFMSYSFMFDQNFSFGSEYRGGKLPGITAGKRCSGVCDGTDGFAARFMWRRNGEGELYLCSLDKTSEYCDDYYFTDPQTGQTLNFEPGQKYNIEEYVRLNTGPLNRDGQIIVWISGVEVLNLDQIRLVTNEDLIDTFYLSMFYGGSTDKWQASNDSYFFIDDIYLRRLNKN